MPRGRPTNAERMIKLMESERNIKKIQIEKKDERGLRKRNEMKGVEEDTKGMEKGTMQEMTEDIITSVKGQVKGLSEKIEEHIKGIQTEIKGTVEKEAKGLKTEIKTEIEGLKEEMRRMEEEWAKEWEKVEKRIEEMEEKEVERDRRLDAMEAEERRNGNGGENEETRKIWRVLEMKERRERRKNIIIRGVELEEKNIKENIEEWMREKLGVKQKVEAAEKRRMGTNKEGKKIEGVLVKLQDVEKKREVMVNRKNLKGTNIFIDDDLTKKEREIQKKIRERAEEERKKGNKVKIGYQKLEVNGAWLKWQEDQEDSRNINLWRRKKPGETGERIIKRCYKKHG